MVVAKNTPATDFENRFVMIFSSFTQQIVCQSHVMPPHHRALTLETGYRCAEANNFFRKAPESALFREYFERILESSPGPKEPGMKEPAQTGFFIRFAKLSPPAGLRRRWRHVR
jgi:hypothetical protein